MSRSTSLVKFTRGVRLQCSPLPHTFPLTVRSSGQLLHPQQPQRHWVGWRGRTSGEQQAVDAGTSMGWSTLSTSLHKVGMACIQVCTAC
jgi:hypothetical protein